MKNANLLKMLDSSKKPWLRISVLWTLSECSIAESIDSIPNRQHYNRTCSHVLQATKNCNYDFRDSWSTASSHYATPIITFLMSYCVPAFSCWTNSQKGIQSP